MPAWVAELGLSLAQALLGDDALKRFVGLVAGIILVLLALVLSLPVLVAQIPLMTADRIGSFFNVASQVAETTKTWDDPDGITIPWDEVSAVWTVLHEQDFSGAGEEAIEDLAGEWAKRYELEETHSDGQGNTWTETHIWYSRRPFAGVMERLGFAPEQEEQARRYLEALREGGIKPPTGWTARSAIGWAWPVPGYDTATAVSSPYGLRIHPITRRPELHLGVDIAAPEGTTVVAAWAGTVTGTGMDATLGRYVVIEGVGFQTHYGHLSSILVQEGEQVQPGQAIGKVGNTGLSTGPHLDFRLRFIGQWQNPLQYF